jgi:hypothetical protein
MAIYFASSDESGSFRREMSKRYIRPHPYYVRATVITLASDWKKLRNELTSLRQQFRIPNNVEVKWSHIWSIWKHSETPRLKRRGILKRAWMGIASPLPPLRIHPRH